MLNRCKHLHMVLHICGVSGTQCRYMADPHTCPNYGEEFDRQYIPDGYKDKDITEVTQLESERIRNQEPETYSEFATRAMEHLRSIGVETEKVKEKEVRKDAPNWF